MRLATVETVLRAAFISAHSGSLLSTHLAVVERPNERRDFVAVILQGEVPRIEHVQLCIFDVALESQTTRLGEDRIVCAPYQQHWRLVLAQILVPARILIDIRPIVVEEVNLNAVIVRPTQEEQIRAPVVRANLFRAASAFTVNPLHTFWSEEICQRCLGLWRTVFPECGSQRVPYAGEAFLVSVTVLRDDAFNPIRMAQRDSESHGGTVV